MTRLAFILVFVLLCGGARADMTPQEQARKLIEQLPPLDREPLTRIKYAGHYSMSQLVRFNNRGERVIARFTLPQVLVAQFEDPSPLLISLEGSSHAWTLHRRKAGTLDTGLSMITLTCYAPDLPGPFNRIALSSDGYAVAVWAVNMSGHPALSQSLNFSQSDRALHVSWRFEAEQFELKRMECAEIGQLPQRLPPAVWQNLLWVLREIGPGRSAGDVYRVFNQIPADAAMTRRIETLVAELDADSATRREKALGALADLGRPAMLSLLRLNRQNLSAEQVGRIDSLVAVDGWVHVDDHAAAAKDPAFLTACLEDEDATVRKVATHMLLVVRPKAPQ